MQEHLIETPVYFSVITKDASGIPAAPVSAPTFVVKKNGVTVAALNGTMTVDADDATSFTGSALIQNSVGNWGNGSHLKVIATVTVGAATDKIVACEYKVVTIQLLDVYGAVGDVNTIATAAAADAASIKAATILAVGSVDSVNEDGTINLLGLPSGLAVDKCTFVIPAATFGAKTIVSSDGDAAVAIESAFTGDPTGQAYYILASVGSDVVVGSAMTLAAGAISSASFTVAAITGPATGILEQMRQVWRSVFKGKVYDPNAETLKHLNDDGTTATTQDLMIDDDGVETQGIAT